MEIQGRSCNLYCQLFILLCAVGGVYTWVPTIWNGRPIGGMLPAPVVSKDAKLPEEQFYEFQRVTHFDGSNVKYWKQRYFVNNATYRYGGPIFLMLGGESEANPAWLTAGSMFEYARLHGALMVLLEHRYYGKSQPVPDLSTKNLEFLSSRQALADTAQFVTYFRWWNHIHNNTKLILFGGSYAGSLAVWFREKYPYLCDGVVASSAPVVATMDFMEFFEGVAEALDTTGPQCRLAIHNATETMLDWYGQPQKRQDIKNMFRLCKKIDYDNIIELNVLFNNIAQHFGDIVVFNHINRSIEGQFADGVTIQQMCDIMTDETRGSTVQRYADVSNLYLDMIQSQCLDVRYKDLIDSMNMTSWNSTSAGGSRQWLYQSCSEFGWFLSSSSMKQPFGSYFSFPWNLTTDQCIDVFNRIYGGSQVIDNCDETNRYYGGLDLSVSNVIFVNGDLDPWKAACVTKPLKYSPNVEILMIHGTSHCADMYPPSDNDPTGLNEARERINQILSKWTAPYYYP